MSDLTMDTINAWWKRLNVARELGEPLYVTEAEHLEMMKSTAEPAESVMRSGVIGYPFGVIVVIDEEKAALQRAGR